MGSTRVFLQVSVSSEWCVKWPVSIDLASAGQNPLPVSIAFHHRMVFPSHGVSMFLPMRDGCEIKVEMECRTPFPVYFSTLPSLLFVRPRRVVRLTQYFELVEPARETEKSSHQILAPCDPSVTRKIGLKREIYQLDSSVLAVFRTPFQ